MHLTDQENKMVLTNDLMEIIKGYPAEQRFSLSILQDLQHTYNYISKEALDLVSAHLSMPVSSLYSMATFYKALSLKPKGRYIIKVCDGTACHIRSSQLILEELESLISLHPGEMTEDGLFSLETVNCVGACALAPVMVINEEYYGKVTRADVKKIIGEYATGGENHG